MTALGYSVFNNAMKSLLSLIWSTACFKCASIVSPPAKGVAGEWKTKAIEGGLEARFEDPNGKLLGFVLLGAATAQRGAMTKELPIIL